MRQWQTTGREVFSGDGHRGWIGAWLDISKVDWSAVDAVLADAYRMTAPRALVAQMNAV